MFGPLEVLRGAIREAKLHDLNVITTESGNRQHPDSSWIDNMLRRQTDGAILVFLQSDTYRTEQAAFQRYSLRLVRSIPVIQIQTRCRCKRTTGPEA